MKKLLVVLSICISFSSFAQDDDIQFIRDTYYDVTTKVNATNDKSSEDINFYHDIRIRNTNNLIWRGFGIYLDTTHYYYNDELDAKALKENTENDRCWAVVFVSNHNQHSYNFKYSEYLFYKGELIFHYCKTQYTGESETEYRYYFSNGSLIRYMVNSEIVDGSEVENGKFVKKSAEEYLKKF